MRTISYFSGFIIFGLVLFFILGDALVDQTWLRSFGNWTWAVAIGLIIADILIPIPTTLIITLMGQIYGPLLGALIGTTGCFAAGLCAYLMTRMLGPRFALWLLKDELPKVERLFAEKGAFAVACSRWLPLLPEAVSCLAGLARMPLGRYCLALLSGAVPMSFAYAMLAEVSNSPIIPLLISVILPIPVWIVAARLLYGSVQQSAST